ncbi:hypothetical protein XCY_002363 [Xanthomonas euroxanthea]|uniref:hypothetical protein n=1 Tax=Xanthomonas euroxanthea TaxID=2259622 RepID=UPI001AFCC23D|nr:hypothetical protein [Xanthomonas euroxanthea]CAG2091175.1 hypothetical protein XCY_002363 [Xanthomonas euroxanthea]
MTSNSPFIGATATIIAALVAGSVTYLVAVFTKESKVSDFRQGWIDNLREDTAKFIGIWYYVAAELELVPSQEFTTRDFWRSMKSEFMELEILQAKIELRLNPNEHASVIEQLKSLAQGESFTGLTHAQRKQEIESFSNDVQGILKSEWRRVKRGEPTYRAIKLASKLALASGLILLLIVGAIRLGAFG